MLQKLELDIDFNKTGKFNMEKDIENAGLLIDNKIKPTLRLYTWKPFCLSLGYNQNDDNIDKAKLNKSGFDIVRRPTGGRAVLHANELTYSIVHPISQDYAPSDLYRDIHILFAEAFKINGIETDLVKTNPDFKKFYKSDERSVSCFASSARYELSYKEKKIVGSAQRKMSNIVLQHGSILIGRGYERLSEFIQTSEENRKRLTEFTLKSTTHINEISSTEHNAESIADILINHFKSRNLLA